MTAYRAPVVGMIGGGQLARMTAQAAIALGIDFRVLALSANDAAARVCSATYGDHRSLADVLAFAAGCDVVTFDHEHVPPDHVAAILARGVSVQPGPGALHYAQDKAAMRQRLAEAGLPVPAWCVAADPDAVEVFAGEHGWPVVAKAIRGGYDGRGVWMLPDASAIRDVLAATHGDAILLEECVPLRRELAALVARAPCGEVRTWPLVETEQRDGICVSTQAPASDPPPSAVPIAARIAAELAVTGVLAVELFERPDRSVLVNELAMRPHNSGHWTIEGARTSQFEQHLRAVLDWPLGDTTATAPRVATANVLGSDDPDLSGRLPAVFAADDRVKVHLYGKAPRPGRKLGHVTVLGSEADGVRRRAAEAAALLRGGTW